jgi:hypothetical protein
MRVLITFKVGDDKGWNHTRHFDLDLGESETLKRDFLTHVNGGIGALSGASYRCIDPDTGQPRDLAIRFSDILYVEFMPQTGVTLDSHSQGQAAGKPISGPLQTRLSTSPLQYRNLASGGKEEE